MENMFVIIADEGIYDSEMDYVWVIFGKENAERKFTDFIKERPTDGYGGISLYKAKANEDGIIIPEDFANPIKSKVWNRKTEKWEDDKED